MDDQTRIWRTVAGKVLGLCLYGPSAFGDDRGHRDWDAVPLLHSRADRIAPAERRDCNGMACRARPGAAVDRACADCLSIQHRTASQSVCLEADLSGGERLGSVSSGDVHHRVADRFFRDHRSEQVHRSSPTLARPRSTARGSSRCCKKPKRNFAPSTK